MLLGSSSPHLWIYPAITQCHFWLLSFIHRVPAKCPLKPAAVWPTADTPAHQIPLLPWCQYLTYGWAPDPEKGHEKTPQAFTRTRMPSTALYLHVGAPTLKDRIRNHFFTPLRRGAQGWVWGHVAGLLSRSGAEVQTKGKYQAIAVQPFTRWSQCSFSSLPKYLYDPLKTFS